MESDMLISFDCYLRVADSRPFKLSPEEVDYRETDEKERCQSCIHFYLRKTDGYAVCEIMRDTKTDEDETPIDPLKVCSYFTKDGDNFPFIESDSDDEETN